MALDGTYLNKYLKKEEIDSTLENGLAVHIILE
jgi:hypothetical protein